MSDEKYIIIKTLETKLSMAHNNGLDALTVTTDVLEMILSLLKEPEENKKPKRFYGAWVCPECGFEVHRNWTNCHKCGAELNF